MLGNIHRVDSYVVLRGAALVCITVLLMAAQAAAFEPLFRGNFARTGYAEEGPEPPLKLKWKFKTRKGVEQIESFPAVDDGLSSAIAVEQKVFVGGHDGWIYCLDAEHGTKLWDYPTRGRVNSTPTFKDGNIFTGSMDGTLYALKASTGALDWSTPFGVKLFKNISYGGIRASPIVAPGGMLFVGG